MSCNSLPFFLNYLYLNILPQVNQTVRNGSLAIFSEEEAGQPFVCAFYNPDFIIYSAIGSFYIPCCIMVILYFRIFKVYTHCK
jgi:hypothetical protein